MDERCQPEPELKVAMRRLIRQSMKVGDPPRWVWGNWTPSRTRFAKKKKLDARVIIHWWVPGYSMYNNLNIVVWIPDEGHYSVLPALSFIVHRWRIAPTRLIEGQGTE